MLTFRCNDYTFAVDAPPSISASLGALLRELVADDDASHRWEISLTEDRATLTIDGRAILTDVPKQLIHSYVNTTLTRQVLDNEPHLLHLHAMAVLDGDSGIVVAGESGAGKSTLCAALVVAGATYLTDETVAVDGDSNGLITYPKPLSVKKYSNSYMWDVAEIDLTDSRGPGPWELEPTILGRSSTSRGLPVRTLATYRNQPDAEAAVKPIHRATLVRRLLADGHDVDRFGASALQVTARLASRATCLALSGGDARAIAPELIAAHRRPFVEGTTQEVLQPSGPGPSRREGIESLVLDGRALLFDERSVQVIELDEAQTVHWLACDGSPLESTVADMAEAFEISLDEATDAVTMAVMGFTALGVLSS